MKKLLVGLLAFGSLSAFATTAQELEVALTKSCAKDLRETGTVRIGTGFYYELISECKQYEYSAMIELVEKNGGATSLIETNDIGNTRARED